MDRRRFLKYAGATAAVLGASALGLDYLVRTPQPVAQTALSSTEAISTTSLSSASSVSFTETASTMELGSLDLGANDLGGYVFPDYNGNGQLDQGEPFVNDVEIVAQGDHATFKVKPQNGIYVFRNLSFERYRLYPVSQNDKFRYMCRSNSELVETRQGYSLDFRGKQKLDMALMEGFLTSPFLRNRSRIDRNGYVDLDPRLNYIRDWKGGDQTYDGHRGTDFDANRGTEILATAPGWIFAAWNGWPNEPSWGAQNDSWKNGNFVIIYHGGNFWSHYHHLDSVAVQEALWGSLRQFVKRGELIGYCGYTGFRPDLVTPMTPDQVHLHFEITDTDSDKGPKDPFRDLYYGQRESSPLSNPVSLWTKDNDPQYMIA